MNYIPTVSFKLLFETKVYSGKKTGSPIVIIQLLYLLYIYVFTYWDKLSYEKQ